MRQGEIKFILIIFIVIFIWNYYGIAGIPNGLVCPIGVRRTFRPEPAKARAIDACNSAGSCVGPNPSSRIYLKRLGVGPSEQGLQDQFKLSLEEEIWPKFFLCKGDELHLGDTGMRDHGDTFGSGNLEKGMATEVTGIQEFLPREVTLE
jgi:hypothetical protein